LTLSFHSTPHTKAEPIVGKDQETRNSFLLIYLPVRWFVGGGAFCFGGGAFCFGGGAFCFGVVGLGKKAWLG